MTKTFRSLALLVSTALLCAAPLAAQAEKKEGPPAQQKKQKQAPLPGAGTGGSTSHATISTTLGGRENRVTISYGRPTVTHPRTGEVRKIWGGLEGWDKPYRLGADEATLLITQKPLEIAGTTIPAGAYTLYLIPSENGPSKLAFSKKLGGWGIPVDTAQDFARVDLTQEKLTQKVEQLTITIEGSGPQSTAGTLKISWDDMQWTLPFTLKTS